MKKKKGFSLLEVMISIFIFSIMMVSVSMTFASLFKNYKNTKKIQQNLENAQFAMNTMAKSLRTSSITPVVSGNVQTVRFFNYSAASENCVAYSFNSGTRSLRISSATIDPAQPTSTKISQCGSAPLTAHPDIISGTVDSVNFNVTVSSAGPTPPKAMGKVTISMKVCASAACPASQDKATIQSSVSLRDYSAIGL